MTEVLNFHIGGHTIIITGDTVVVCPNPKILKDGVKNDCNKVKNGRYLISIHF